MPWRTIVAGGRTWQQKGERSELIDPGTQFLPRSSCFGWGAGTRGGSWKEGPYGWQWAKQGQSGARDGSMPTRACNNPAGMLKLSSPIPRLAIISPTSASEHRKYSLRRYWGCVVRSKTRSLDEDEDRDEGERLALLLLLWENAAPEQPSYSCSAEGERGIESATGWLPDFWLLPIDVRGGVCGGCLGDPGPAETGTLALGILWVGRPSCVC